MERTVFTTQLMFDFALRGKLAAAIESRVFEQLRPGEGSDQAEALLEAAFDLAQPGIKPVLAGGFVLGDAAEQRIRVEQLVERDRGIGIDRIAGAHAGEVVERIRHLQVPVQRIYRPSGDKRRRVVLLPIGKAGFVFIPAPRNVVGLVVRVPNLEEPAVPFVLHVQAVFPGVEAVEIRIVPGPRVSQMRQRTQRRPGGRQNSVLERVRHGIERGEVVIGGGRQGRGPAVSKLRAGVVTRLGEAAETAANYRIVAQIVSETRARLPFMQVRVVGGPRDAIDAGKLHNPIDLELAGGEKLLQELHAGVTGIGRIRQNGGVGGLRRRADRVRRGGVVPVFDPVEPLLYRTLVVPMHAQIYRQFGCHAPVILEKAGGVVLRVKRASVARHVAARRHVQKEGGEGRAHARSAGVRVVLPRKVAIKIEFARVSVAEVGVLQHPELTAVAEGMVAVHLREGGAQGVISSGVKTLRLGGSEVARNTGDVRETRPRQLTYKAGGNAEGRLVKARARVIARLFVTRQAVAQVKNLGGADGPHVIQTDALVDALGETSGGNIIQPEGVAGVFNQVMPAEGHKGALVVVPVLIQADRYQRECV